MKNKFIIIVLVFCLMINIFYPAKANAEIDIVPDNIKPYLAAALVVGGVIYQTADGIEGAVQSYWDTLSSNVKDKFEDIAEFGNTTFIITSAIWSSVRNWTDKVNDGVIESVSYLGEQMSLVGTVGQADAYFLPSSQYYGEFLFRVSSEIAYTGGAYSRIYRTETKNLALVEFERDLDLNGNRVMRYIIEAMVNGSEVVIYTSEWLESNNQIVNLTIINNGEGMQYLVDDNLVATSNTKYPISGRIKNVIGSGSISTEVYLNAESAIEIPVAGNLSLDNLSKDPDYDPTGRKVALPPGALENLLDYLLNEPDVSENMPDSAMDLETGTLQSWSHQIWQTAVNSYNLLRDLPTSIANMLSSLFIPTIALTDVFSTVKTELGDKLLIAVPTDFLNALQDKEPPIWYLGDNVLIDWSDFDVMVAKLKMWCGGIMIVLTTIWCIKMWMPRTTID